MIMAGEAQQSILQRMGVILRCPQVAIFLVMAVLFGFGMGTIDGFVFLYLKQLGERHMLQLPCCLASGLLYNTTSAAAISSQC